MKLLVLISGGIDSSVAAYMMMESFDLDFIFFFNKPLAYGKDTQLAINCIKQLKFKKNIRKKLRLFVVTHGDTLMEIMESCPANLRCILCRRMMYRIANEVGRKNYRALITGESLGQVASQTMENLFCTDEASNMAVLRPLIGYDKMESVRIAEEIGTYELSKEHSCCRFVPDMPRTKCRMEEVWEAEKNLDIEKIVSDAVKNVITISV